MNTLNIFLELENSVLGQTRAEAQLVLLVASLWWERVIFEPSNTLQGLGVSLCNFVHKSRNYLSLTYEVFHFHPFPHPQGLLPKWSPLRQCPRDTVLSQKGCRQFWQMILGWNLWCFSSQAKLLLGQLESNREKKEHTSRKGNQPTKVGR